MIKNNNELVEAPYAHYLMAASSSLFWSAKDWISWADKIIETNENIPNWILEVSTSSDLDELEKALVDQLRYEQDLNGNIIPIANSKIGFLFKRYELDTLPLDSLLRESGLLAEGGFTNDDPEVFYDLLNKFELGAAWDGLPEQIENLFFSYKQLACEQIDVLRNASKRSRSHVP